MRRLAAWFRRVSAPRDAELERRLRACEINLQNIWEHLNAQATDRPAA